MYSVLFPNGTTEKAENYKELAEIARDCCNGEQSGMNAAIEIGLKKDYVIAEYIDHYIHENAEEIINDFGCTITEV